MFPSLMDSTSFPSFFLVHHILLFHSIMVNTIVMLYNGDSSTTYYVIRCYDGTVICNYSEPVGAFDTNEAKIYSLLVGCKELNRMSSFRSRVESVSMAYCRLGGQIHSLNTYLSLFSMLFLSLIL